MMFSCKSYDLFDCMFDTMRTGEPIKNYLAE
jgi:hypothetical protein